MTEQEGFIPIPNKVFDKYMVDLKPSEFMVLCAIIRKTWGWRKKEDKISISQLAALTKLSRQTIVNSLKFLQTQKLISTKKRHNQITKIRLEIPSLNSRPPSLNFSTEGSLNSRHTTIHNNTNKPRQDSSPILGGLIDYREYED